MKKVFILSYYFPPANVTASERIASFARYLQNGSYYPVVITRNWDYPIKNSTSDVYRSSGTEIRIEKKEGYEVHYLPYRASLKDHLFIRLEGTPFYFIYLIAAFIFSVTNLMALRFSSYGFLYRYLVQQFKNEKEPIRLVVSAMPFELFGIAWLLQKKFPLKWIADYRDDWSSSSLYGKNLVRKIQHRVFAFFEKKWLKSASLFLSVSEHYVDKIARVIHRPGKVLFNGFLPENYPPAVEASSVFTLCYVGSVYPSQPIEKLIEGILLFIRSYPKAPPVKVCFIGIGKEPKIIARIQQYISGYESYFEFTDRLPKKEAIHVQMRSHALLICAHGSLKGIPGSKLYEYIAIKKPVIVYPTDGDIIETSLRFTRQGLFCRDAEEMKSHLQTLYGLFLEHKPFSGVDEQAVASFTREEQCKVLITALDQIDAGAIVT
ncbi:MAG TPA: glycosyltransferase [Chitinophagaceae bacterium]|nr:glycosyltransferase [Chitinophagaceae bacterium]